MKLFRWALWWGLGIVVACIALMFILDDIGGGAVDNSAAPMMDVVYWLVYSFGIWPIMIYIGVIGPVLEELMFRSWGNGKAWTGYTSVVLMAGFALATTQQWMAPVVLAAGVAIMVLLRHQREHRLFALMLLSSVAFALGHADNYDAGAAMLTVSLLHKFGMGLVASYLVINHNLLWSIGFHILNNSIIAIPLGIGFNMACNETQSVETDQFRLDLAPALVYRSEWESRAFNVFYADSAVFFDSPNNIAYCLMAGEADTANGLLYKNASGDYPKVTLAIHYKQPMHDPRQVVRTMEEQGWITLDTVEAEYPVTRQFSHIGNDGQLLPNTEHTFDREVNIHNSYNPLDML